MTCRYADSEIRTKLFLTFPSIADANKNPGPFTEPFVIVDPDDLQWKKSWSDSGCNVFAVDGNSIGFFYNPTDARYGSIGDTVLYGLDKIAWEGKPSNNNFSGPSGSRKILLVGLYNNPSIIPPVIKRATKLLQLLPPPACGENVSGSVGYYVPQCDDSDYVPLGMVFSQSNPENYYCVNKKYLFTRPLSLTEDTPFLKNKRSDTVLDRSGSPTFFQVCPGLHMVTIFDNAKAPSGYYIIPPRLYQLPHGYVNSGSIRSGLYGENMQNKVTPWLVCVLFVVIMGIIIYFVTKTKK